MTPPATVTPECRVSLDRALTAAHLEQFLALTEDANPLHRDAGFAGATRFGRRLIPGPFLSGLFGALCGQLAPGCLTLSQETEFAAPIFVGDRLHLEACLNSLDPSGAGCVSLRAVNQHGQVVALGQATLRILAVRDAAGRPTTAADRALRIDAAYAGVTA